MGQVVQGQKSELLDAIAERVASRAGKTKAKAAAGFARVYYARVSPGDIQSTSIDDLAGAAEAVRASGFTDAALVGASIALDPAWQNEQINTEPQKGTVRAVVEDLDRLLADGALVHDGGAVLSAQVLGLRTLPGVDGPRVRSTIAADAVKAAVRAAVAARATPRVPAIY